MKYSIGLQDVLEHIALHNNAFSGSACRNTIEQDTNHFMIHYIAGWGAKGMCGDILRHLLPSTLMKCVSPGSSMATACASGLVTQHRHGWALLEACVASGLWGPDSS